MNPYKAFAKSPHHAWLGALTLAGGLATGSPLFLLIGAAAYALGWIYLPDSRLFKTWWGTRLQKQNHTQSAEAEKAFQMEQKRIYGSLRRSRQIAYNEMEEIAEDIEEYIQEHAAKLLSPENQEQQLDRLMWTYLRLLKTEQDQDEFLDRENPERLTAEIKDLKETIARLDQDIQAQESAGNASTALSRQRMRNSKSDRLEAMEKRMEKIIETQGNLELATSERERIASLVKLIRADFSTLRDPAEFSRRIDASAEELGSTNDWLSGLDDFDREDAFPAPRSSARHVYTMRKSQGHQDKRRDSETQTAGDDD